MTTVGTATLNASGVATVTVTQPTVGSHSYTARYGGDSNYLTGTSTAQAVTVAKAASATALVASYSGDTNFTGSVSGGTAVTVANVPTLTNLATSAPQIVYGQAVTLTAVVQSNLAISPGGTVTFSDNAAPVGTAPVDAQGQAVLTLPALAAGTHGFTASFSGSGGYMPSRSAQIVVQVKLTVQ